MNAVIETVAEHKRAPVAPPHPTHTFKLLLRREFWENKGGFLWAPIITGAILLVLSLLGTITTLVMYFRFKDSAQVDIDKLNLKLSGEAQHAMGFAGDLSLLGGVGITCVVMVFVVFFYALGSLYDDRRDRSVLFWKSLPVSDTQTVLAKVTWALLLAPAIAVGIGFLIGVSQWLIGLATTSIVGISGATAMVTEAHPLRVLWQTLSLIPVYAFWALPTVGWLMLCSAWAKSKPFLWAVLLPILGCTVISWTSTLPWISIQHDTLWYTIAFRGLLSIIPGTWYLNPHVSGEMTPKINQASDLANALDLSTSWSVFATVDLWAGAIVGAAMIYAAIRLRRWRDEG